MSDVVARLNAALEGRYAIERQLGEGGMATVYLADDLKHERKVALKVLKPELAAVVGAERFLAEIKTTANLQHPHILPLFDSGEADSFLFYVMPYVEGETLQGRIDREKQLPVDEAVRIATAAIDIRTTPPPIWKLPPGLQGEAMGHNFVDRLTAEEEGKILPVAQVVDQIAVEGATRLSALAGGVRRDGPVQIR